jgi:endoglucanase
MQANSDVWVGWTYWAAGPWLSPDYLFNIEPKAGADANRIVGTLKKYF